MVRGEAIGEAGEAVVIDRPLVADFGSTVNTGRPTVSATACTSIDVNIQLLEGRSKYSFSSLSNSLSSNHAQGDYVS